VFVLTHLGMGDHITAIGLIRYLSTYYDEVVIFYLKEYLGLKKYNRNYENLRLIYEDDPCISFYACDNFINLENHNYDINKVNEIIRDCANCTAYEFIDTGWWNGKYLNLSRVPLAYYQQLNYDYKIFRNYYHIPEKEEYTQLYMLLKNQEPNYAFVHNFSDRGLQFTMEEVEQKMQVTKNEIFFVNPNFNCYEPGSDRHELANKLIGHLIPYYIEIIKNSKFNLLCDSAFFCMAVNLDINHDNNFFLSNTQTNYDFLFEDEMTKNKFRDINSTRVIGL
jgi:hypothetical protein